MFLAFNLVNVVTRALQRLLVWLQLASILLLSVVLKAVCKSIDQEHYRDAETIYRNIAQVSGGERELRTTFLKPFNRACIDALTIMTAYSSYDGIPAIANSRE